MVEALAMALAAGPGNRQPVSAVGMVYFRAEARRRLSLTDDAAARGLLLGFWRHRKAR